MNIYLYLLLSIIMYVLVLYNFVEIKNATKFIYGTIINIFLVSIAYLFSNSVFISGIIMFTGFLVLLLILKYSLFNSCITSVLAMVYLLICNEILGRFLGLLLGTQRYAVLQNKPTAKIGLMIMFGTLAFLTSRWIRRYTLQNGAVKGIVKNRNFKFLAILLGLFLFVAVYVSVHMSAVEVTDIILYMMGFLFFIVLLYLIYTSSIKEEKMEIKQLELMQLQIYTENLEYIYNDMRKIRHDYMNVLSSMVGYMEVKDMDGLIEFFDHHVLAFSQEMKTLDYQLGRLSNIKQRELKGLIAIKIVKAQELGIDVTIDIMEPIEITEINPIDMCRMLGILLDNAIDGALEAKQKILQLGLIAKKKSKVLVIINSCKDEQFNIYQLYQKGYSTKGENRGLGLNNLKEIIAKYSYCDLETLVENYEFKQIIEIQAQSV